MRQYFLRPLKETDAERMLEWMKNKRIMQYLRIDGEHMTIVDTGKFIVQAQDETVCLHRAVTSSDDQYYGTVSLKNIDRDKREAEYAITLHPDAIGTGAARSVSLDILKIAFEELSLERVYLNVIRENIRAVRLYEGLGFRYLYSTEEQIRSKSVVLKWYEISQETYYREQGASEERMKKLIFKINGDDRGKLIAVEGVKDIPFQIARIFYIYGADSESVRGCHANRKSEFVLISIIGSAKIKVMDGKEKRIFILDKPNVGVYTPKMTWKEMYDFSEDAVLLCLASEEYDPAEYICDYDEYIKEAQGHE